MLKVLFRIIFAVLIIALVLVSLHLLFNGGITYYKLMIQEYGFWGAVKEFFVQIWTGFKATCGIK